MAEIDQKGAAPHADPPQDTREPAAQAQTDDIWRDAKVINLEAVLSMEPDDKVRPGRKFRSPFE